MKKTINILQVLDNYYPSFDGPTLLITNYTIALNKKENVKTQVMVPAFPKYKDTQPFDVIRVKSIKAVEKMRSAVPAFDKNFKKFFKENKIDIIHVHSPFVLGRAVLKIAKKFNIPTVLTIHTRYHEDFERLLSKPIQKFMMKYILKTMKLADNLLTVSEGTIETLKGYGYTKPIGVIRNGTDLIYPDNADELIKKINDTYDLKNQKNVFLSVGRIVLNKKLDLAIRALKIVKDKGYDFKFLIVGSGSYEQELKNLTQQLELSDNIIFTGKVMDRLLLSGHYLRSNLFLFPSTFDTASLAPIEAASMKLPTLMTKGCSTAEIIEDGVSGFLAEESAEAWSDKIIEIIKNNDKLLKMKETTYAKVYRTWDQVTDEILDYYKQIIKNKSEKDINQN